MTIVQTFKKIDVLYCILAFIIFLQFLPYIVWHSAYHAYALIVLEFIIFCKKSYKLNYRFTTCLALLFVSTSYIFIIDPSISSFLGFLLIGIFLIKDDAKMKLFSYFRTIYALILILSIAVYLAVIWFQIDLPSETMLPQNANKDFWYTVYPFLATGSSERQFFTQYRFNCMFDEPGVVGTIAACMLFADRFSLRKWQNIVIFISGLISFSLYFIVVALLFSIIYMSKKIQFKTVFYILCGIVAIAYVSLFVFEHTDNKFDIDILILDRLDGDHNNRSTVKFDRAYEDFITTPEVFFGKGVNAHSLVDDKIQTYKMMIYDYGIIYVAISLSVLFIYGFRIYGRNHSGFYLYVLFLLLLYYQRPNSFEMSGYFLLFTTIPLVQSKTYNNLISNNQRQ